jgi:hypothetical protein
MPPRLDDFVVSIGFVRRPEASFADEEEPLSPPPQAARKAAAARPAVVAARARRLEIREEVMWCQ